MTDILYPSHPSLMDEATSAAYHPSQIQRLNNPVPQTYMQQVSPQPSYTTPHLPQSYHAAPRYDIDIPQPPHTPHMQMSPEPMRESEDKLLQNVTWSNYETTPVPMQSPRAHLTASSAYPPMPSAQAVSNSTANGPDIDSEINGITDESSKGLMSSVRQRMSSRPKKVKPKTIIEKANTDIVADPKKPRSARSIFLTGVLGGAVMMYVLMTSFAKITAEKEYATVAAPKAIATQVKQAEKLNDDLIDAPNTSGQVIKKGVKKNSSEVFLDEQLDPSN